MAEGEEDAAQKTEEATPKKLEDSRNKGEVASSKEVNNWFILLGGSIMLISMSPGFFAELKTVLTYPLAFAHNTTLVGGAAGDTIFSLIFAVGKIMIVPLGMLFCLAAASSLVQTGIIFSAESLKPKLSKISFGSGFKRLFSSRSLMEFLKGILKLAIVGVVVTIVITPVFDNLETLLTITATGLLEVILGVASKVIIAVLSVVTVIAAIDYIYQQMEHSKKMKMSRQEIKDEMKQSDGDPMIKARLRQIRSERARQRMMQSVPESTVVITNPTHFAIALKYESDEMDAPELVAKGADAVAMRIRAVATENNIPIVENPPLARALFAGVEVGQSIPPEHYHAIAKIIGYVMKLRGRGGSGARARS
jgi:flagellar biosynthesis protein FlhB